MWPRSESKFRNSTNFIRKKLILTWNHLVWFVFSVMFGWFFADFPNRSWMIWNFGWIYHSRLIKLRIENVLFHFSSLSLLIYHSFVPSTCSHSKWNCRCEFEQLFWFFEWASKTRFNFNRKNLTQDFLDAFNGDWVRSICSWQRHR